MSVQVNKFQEMPFLAISSKNANENSTCQYCLSRSTHRPPNFTNPEFQFPQFKVLQRFFSFLYNELYCHFWMYFDINLKLLPGKNKQD